MFQGSHHSVVHKAKTKKQQKHAKRNETKTKKVAAHQQIIDLMFWNCIFARDGLLFNAYYYEMRFN